MDHNIYLLMSHRYLQGLLVLLDIEKIKNNSVCYLSIMTYWLVMLGFVYCVPCMYWDLQCELLSFKSLIGRAIIFTFLHFLFSQCKSESAWKVFIHSSSGIKKPHFFCYTHSFFFFLMHGNLWMKIVCAHFPWYNLCPSRVSGLTSELRLLKCQSFVQTKALLGTSLTWIIRVHVHDQLLMLL